MHVLLVSPQAGWALHFLHRQKNEAKNARKGKLLRQTLPFRAAATRSNVFPYVYQFGAFNLLLVQDKKITFIVILGTFRSLYAYEN